MSKKSRTLADTMEDTRDRHRRYMRAIQHPIRRDILRAMYKGANSMEKQEKAQTGIPGFPLESVVLSMVLAVLVLWYAQRQR